MAKRQTVILPGNQIKAGGPRGRSARQTGARRGGGLCGAGFSMSRQTRFSSTAWSMGLKKIFLFEAGLPSRVSALDSTIASKIAGRAITTNIDSARLHTWRHASSSVTMDVNEETASNMSRNRGLEAEFRTDPRYCGTLLVFISMVLGISFSEDTSFAFVLPRRLETYVHEV